jgi:hypothetical protein
MDEETECQGQAISGRDRDFRKRLYNTTLRGYEHEMLIIYRIAISFHHDASKEVPL